MSEVDNDNNYHYNQALGEKHVWEKQYIISILEVWA